MLLHDPAGHDAWQGTFRLVTLVRAELEPEMAADPLLPEVCWSWLTGALQARGLTYGEPSGTVTRASSHYFGGLSARPAASQIEIRASWTPREGLGGVPDTAAHLASWCDLLAQVAGLPPAGPGDASIVTLPQRRGPAVPLINLSDPVLIEPVRGGHAALSTITPESPLAESLCRYGHFRPGIRRRAKPFDSSNDRPRVRIARIVTH